MQVWPEGQPAQVVASQVPGSPPELPPLLVETDWHWQLAVSQVVPEGQVVPQFAGQTQPLVARSQLVGATQGGLQELATHWPFVQV